MEDSIYAYQTKAEVKREEIVDQVKEVSDSFTHVVKKGESLGSIAKKYHVSVSKIKQWNRLRKDTIHVGQKLVIYRSGAPMAQVGKTSSKSANTSKQANATVRTHTVKRGETLSSIARKYHCTVKDIKKWNGLKRDNVQAGQKLKIKK